MSRCSVLIGSVQCPYLNVAAPDRETVSTGDAVMTKIVVAPTDATVLNTRKMILMENSQNPLAESQELALEDCATKHIVLDEAEALLLIQCDDERVFDAGLADLSLLEHGTLEP
jgi:hypothetical protein